MIFFFFNKAHIFKEIILILLFRTEEDLRSSQSSWCSETCQELDVCSNKTNSMSNNNINTNDFMCDEWIVFLRQSATEVKL